MTHGISILQSNYFHRMILFFLVKVLIKLFSCISIFFFSNSEYVNFEGFRIVRIDFDSFFLISKLKVDGNVWKYLRKFLFEIRCSIIDILVEE